MRSCSTHSVARPRPRTTRLIARFFDIDSGELRVGGVDVRRLDPTALLDEIAIVFQDVYLFDDTIEDNLRLARPGATWDELREAASAARLDEVIERLPAGWNTRVGEGGAQLSGGERQRVAIARAMLKRARIVLVGEAGSALDPENEAAITRAIANLGSDPERTVIVIAHRPATLATADHVVALDRGRVVEAGTRAELLRTGGRVRASELTVRAGTSLAHRPGGRLTDATRARTLRCRRTARGSPAARPARTASAQPSARR
ncbi:ATP-binding cassette domain-containing protein [Streptomyces griseus]|uniref:ATP-binding cassette domain-containing protein n=1 Tax=Streptomyces griseus TaxID=1911 RepID=UPI0038042DF3